MFQHILAALDLSEAGTKVLQRSAELARASGARLTVIHVCEPHVTGYGDATSKHHIANEIQLKQACFPKLKAILEPLADLDPESQLLLGQPADVIHQFAEENCCDLIVMGNHGYSGIKAMLGSTVNKVMHSASCDVHTVRIAEG